MRSLFAVFLVAAVFCGSGLAREKIAGPVLATVLDVYDGDTLLVAAKVWPGHEIRVRVRIRGVDAPEMKSRCRRERVAARHARRKLSSLVGPRPVYLSNISGGKYWGRVLADVSSHSGDDLERLLLESRLVRPYRGHKRKSWCGDTG